MEIEKREKRNGWKAREKRTVLKDFSFTVDSVPCLFLYMDGSERSSIDMPTLVPFVRSSSMVHNSDLPDYSEGNLIQSQRNKPIVTTVASRPGIQSIPEFILEMIRSSSRVNHEGIISLRMVPSNDINPIHQASSSSRDHSSSNDINPIHQASSSSRDHHSKTLSGDLVSKIEDSFERFFTFVHTCPSDYEPYLNGISFTLFIKSFIQLFDLGHKTDGKLFLKLFVLIIDRLLL